MNGKLFQVTEENSDGKIKAKCCLCPASKPPLSGSKKATSNFLLFLKRKHPAEDAEFEKSKKARQDDFQKIPKTTQKTLLQFCNSKKVTQDAASKAIVNLVVKCSLPLSLVGAEPLEQLVSTLSSGTSKFISRKSLSAKID